MSRYGLKSPETRFLLACCRGADAGVYARLLDWGHTLRRAELSGLAPLVYARLKLAPDLVPADILRAFRERYAATAACNMRQMHRLGEVLRVFERRSIPVMPLKGAALLALVYRDPGLRPMTDVDLLVRREDLRRAADALREAGLTPIGREEDYARRGHHHWIPYVSPDGALAVELHHDLAPAGRDMRVDVEDLWRRAQPAAMGRAAVWLPSPAHLLLHLAMHAAGAQLFDRSLGGLQDIARTVRSLGETIDWTELAATARAWNASRYAYCTLRLTEEMLPSGIPAAVLDRLRVQSGFGAGERAALMGMARYLVLRPRAFRTTPYEMQEKLWRQAILPGSLPSKAIGAMRIAGECLAHSARVARPDLDGALAPFYAALVHPWVLLRRRVRAQ